MFELRLLFLSVEMTKVGLRKILKMRETRRNSIRSLASAGSKEIRSLEKFLCLWRFCYRKSTPRTLEIFLNTDQTQTPASLGSLVGTLVRSYSFEE